MEPETAAAGAVKISAVAFNPSVKVGGGSRGDGFDAAHIQINHTAAFTADKVVMGRGM